MRARKHLTYANVVASIALFGVIAGGGAYAAAKISSADIKSQAVTRPKLAAEAVSGSKIAEGAVGSAQFDRDAAGVAAIGLHYDNGAVINQFNRLGDGWPRVERRSTGVFDVFFPGADDAQVLGDLIEVVTAVNGGHATVVHDACSGSCLPVHPVVKTYNDAGDLADMAFTYVGFPTEPPPLP